MSLSEFSEYVSDEKNYNGSYYKIFRPGLMWNGVKGEALSKDGGKIRNRRTILWEEQYINKQTIINKYKNGRHNDKKQDKRD